MYVSNIYPHNIKIPSFFAGIFFSFCPFLLWRSTRYLNESSQRLPTLALNGLAPIAATFSDAGGPKATTHHHDNNLSNRNREALESSSAANNPTHEQSPPRSRPYAFSAFEEHYSKRPQQRTIGTLRANLQTCSQTDLSASNGVLHILDSFDPFEADRSGGEILSRSVSNEAIADTAGRGKGAGEDENRTKPKRRSAAAMAAAAGVVVPDVLELTYALGFNKTYHAIVSSAAGIEDEKEKGVAIVVGGVDNDAEEIIEAASAVAGDRPATGRGSWDGAFREGMPGGSGNGMAKNKGEMSVADALRGADAHTLLVVRDSRAGNDSVNVDVTGSGEMWGEEGGLSEDTLR